MLIAINGEADNGKDLVADFLVQRFDLVKIAFADPMKRFVRMFFGISQENLWGPSEKRNEVLDAGPIWNTAFQQIHTMHQFTTAIVDESLGVDVRVKAFDLMQQWVTMLRRQYSDKISARVILQTLGTEWGRDLYPNVWVDYLFKKQLPLLLEGYPHAQTLGVKLHESKESPKNGLCIPDARFDNEIRACEERGGYTVRVRRLSRTSQSVGVANHRSEKEQRDIPDERFSKVFNFEEGLDKVYEELNAWADQVALC